MAVFDELNKGPRRLDDPEARQVEQIKRVGEAKNLKRKSSGVTIDTYRRSVLAVYWIVGLAVLGGIGYVGYIVLSAFMSN